MFEDELLDYVEESYDISDLHSVAFMPMQCTDLLVFDLLDKQEDIVQLENTGAVTYENHSGIPIKIIDFEKLMNQFLYKGKRCDMIVFPLSGNLYFILNE